MFGFVLWGWESKLNSDLNVLKEGKVSRVVGVAVSPSSSIIIKAGETTDFTVTFPIPKNCYGMPFFAYVKSTGWAGLIQQGVIVSATENKATFTLYNTTSSSRTVTPQCIALFLRLS